MHVQNDSYVKLLTETLQKWRLVSSQ